MSALRWSDTFLFFYWDIKRYRPEHEKRVDSHIRNFLQESAPSAFQDRVPDSWDDVLYRLMRSLRCHLGSNISPTVTHNYIWLDSANLSRIPSKPYVDWFNIEKYYNSFKAATATQDVVAILEEMDAAAHRESAKVKSFNPISAWLQNLSLHEFSMSHLTNPWTVPLPTDMETIMRLAIPNFNVDISKTASVQTLIAEYAGLKLHLYFEKDQMGWQSCDLIRLSLDAPDMNSSTVIDGTAINLLKFCFASILRWVGRICAEGKPVPGPAISKLRLKAIKEGTFYRLGLERELWEAMRDFGIQRGGAVQRYKQRRGRLSEAAAPTAGRTGWKSGRNNSKCL
ncbi:hypothetical protein CcaCcLH18_04968 [Colletotrichum camelliae]|nr:hypothetical protein CcaCcLH18_04968 [Colletotrichum camelliae]